LNQLPNNQKSTMIHRSSKRRWAKRLGVRLVELSGFLELVKEKRKHSHDRGTNEVKRQ